MTRQTQYLLAAVCLVLSAFAGTVNGQLRNAHDAREVFYLTNPDGPAGVYAAPPPTSTACNAEAVRLGLCSNTERLAAIRPWVATASRN